jgi:endonuclease III
LLVAVVLSAQATDVGVNKATRLLFAGGEDAAAKMVALGEEASSSTSRRSAVQRQGEERHRAQSRC